MPFTEKKDQLGRIVLDNVNLLKLYLFNEKGNICAIGNICTNDLMLGKVIYSEL